jgi:protocatechuate 3,4-dioxygenase beta subunit
MKRREPLWIAVLSLASLWVLCLAALAQSANATLSGTVTDESGGVLPGVEITITDTDRGTSRRTVTDDEGRYRVSELVPGNYELRRIAAEELRRLLASADPDHPILRQLERTKELASLESGR